MDRQLTLEFVRVTEAAALASARWMGRGNEKAADQAAVTAMREMLNSVAFEGRVSIGEGERDEAPMLYIGEKVGTGEGPCLDVALDPLEGTTVCAKGGTNSLSVLAIADQGCFLHAPDVYMEKIAVGPEAVGVIDLKQTATENIHRVAEAKKRALSELTVAVLDRPRHLSLIEEVRKTGARIWLIGDGDVSAAIATCLKETGVDLLLGSGGAPEGVLAAAALRCLGGDFQGRLIFDASTTRERARQMGIQDLDKQYQIQELASGDVLFCATGVTQGPLLKGVRFVHEGAFTHSLVMRSRTGTVRFVETRHCFAPKSSFLGNASLF